MEIAGDYKRETEKIYRLAIQIFAYWIFSKSMQNLSLKVSIRDITISPLPRIAECKNFLLLFICYSTIPQNDQSLHIITDFKYL